MHVGTTKNVTKGHRAGARILKKDGSYLVKTTASESRTRYIPDREKASM